MARILIIDDKPAIRAFFEEELAARRHTVTGIGDPALLSTAIRSQKPDIVLLDLYMKGHSGWNLLQEIQKESPGLPVVILTAYDNFSEDPRMGMAEGMVIKSFDLSELLEVIRQTLRKERGEKGVSSLYDINPAEQHGCGPSPGKGV